jgi:WD40 repeat protein
MKLLCCLILSVALAFPQAAPETELKAADHKAQVQGDLKGAIEAYRQILAKHSRNRAVAARAMLAMAECHEKLGQAEARKLYEEIARTYGDQSAVAAQARTRLAALGGGAPGETRARLVWDKAIDAWGCVTADGKLMSFIDWSTGDLAVRNLVTGENRRVTNKGGYEKAMGEAEASCISPDGKRISFNWNRWDPAAEMEGGYELRVIDTDGSGERMLRRTHGYVEASGWSPDGALLAISHTPSPGGESLLELIPMNGGEARVVPTKGKLLKFDISFSPDGKWLAYDGPVRPQANTSRNVFVIAADGAGAETQVVEDADLMGWAPDGKGILVVKKTGETGRLYLVPVANGRANGQPVDLHAPAILGFPGRLAVTSKGEIFYSTNNYQIEGWLLRPDSAKGDWSAAEERFPIAGIGWAANAGNLRFSPDGKQLAAFVPGQAIAIRQLAENRRRSITPPLKDYRNIEWTPDGQHFLASATGEDGRFGIHRIDAATGAAQFLCAIERGHVFVPEADGNSIFEMGQKGLTRYDLRSCAKQELPIRNFNNNGPGGLKLSRDGKSLLVKTMRYIGVYDIAAGTLRDIHYRKEEVGSIVWAADWSADGQRIIATVRPGMGAEHRELWTFPASGGTPAVQALPVRFRGFSVSADGVNVAAMRDYNHRQVWSLENFLPSAK